MMLPLMRIFDDINLEISMSCCSCFDVDCMHMQTSYSIQEKVLTMGIQGLLGYMERNFRGWHHKDLNGNNLVIDGRSILYRLNAKATDWSYGGQFYELRSKIASFYSCLIKCDVIPTVVFDGISHFEEKLDTMVQRKIKKDCNHNSLCI